MNQVLLFAISIHVADSNLLCDTSRWNDIKGTWAYDPTNCMLNNTDTGEGNIIWFGDASGNTPDSTFNSFGAFSLSVDISVKSGTGGGILFRARSVSTTNNDGEQYWLAVRPGEDKVLVARLDGSYSSREEATVSLSYNTVYTVLIESIINDYTNYNVYLDGSFLFTVELTDFTDGSIGFRTYNAPSMYYNLNYTGTLLVPTSYPTLMPSMPITTTAPSGQPSSTPTNVPSGQPTSDPSSVPTAGPTNEPSVPVPSNVPTMTPTIIGGGGENTPTAIPTTGGSGNGNSGGSQSGLETFELLVILLLSFICLFFACTAVATGYCAYDRYKARKELSASGNGCVCCVFRCMRCWMMHTCHDSKKLPKINVVRVFFV